MSDEPKALKDQRIHVLMTEEEVQAVDDWAFAHRIKSRGEAMRRMCQMALTVDARLPVLMKSLLEELNKFHDARDAVKKAKQADPIDFEHYVRKSSELDVKSLDLALRAVFGLSELLVTTAPLKSGKDVTEAIELRDALAKRVAELDPDDREDALLMGQFLRAAGGVPEPKS